MSLTRSTTALVGRSTRISVAFSPLKIAKSQLIRSSPQKYTNN